MEGTPRRQLFPVSPVKESNRECDDETPPVSPGYLSYDSPDILETDEQVLTSPQKSMKKCPPTPRLNRATPLEKQKQKRRMSEITKSTHFNFGSDEDEDMCKTATHHHAHHKLHCMVASNSVPDLRITPADDEETEVGFIMKSPRLKEPSEGFVLKSPRYKKLETPVGTPLRVVTYKTNVNPFSPSRGHPPVLKEIQIPTEKDAVPRYVSDFEQHEEIGKGSFGSVHLCLNRTDGWSYAIKKLVYMGDKMRDKFLKEAYCFAAIGHHPHIIRYYGSWEDKMNTTVYIQTEWCKGGSLIKHPICSQNDLCKVIQHVGSALSYMHSKGFAHGDVKPENILVDTLRIEDDTSYKLCDLGQIDESGDGKYLAPEILQYDDVQQHIEPKVMAKADIFSLGMTIFELAYERYTKSILPIKQRSQISPEDIQLPSHLYDQSFVDLLRGMMQRDPSLRLTGEEVLRHPPLVSSTSIPSADLVSMALLEQEQRKVAFLQKRIEELEQQLKHVNNMSKRRVLTPKTLNDTGNLFEKHLMPVVSKSSHKPTKKLHRKSAENLHRSSVISVAFVDL